jgi:hypothetical protein
MTRVPSAEPKSLSFANPDPLVWISKITPDARAPPSSVVPVSVPPVKRRLPAEPISPAAPRKSCSFVKMMSSWATLKTVPTPFAPPELVDP